jgi:6-pyruvoyl-tetrahydropterin synthase
VNKSELYLNKRLEQKRTWLFITQTQPRDSNTKRVFYEKLVVVWSDQKVRNYETANSKNELLKHQNSNTKKSIGKLASEIPLFNFNQIKMTHFITVR